MKNSTKATNTDSHSCEVTLIDVFNEVASGTHRAQRKECGRKGATKGLGALAVAVLRRIDRHACEPVLETAPPTGRARTAGF